MAVVGVDGCKDCWFAIRINHLDHGGWETRVFRNIAALFNEWSDASLILIDAPIGLPDSTRPSRAADRLARKALGGRGTTVFSAPGRAAIDEFRLGGYQRFRAGLDANRRELGKGLNKQTWGIVPKIGEVDEFLRSREAARVKIREVHPELCFWGFNGGQAMPQSKKTEEGIAERQQVLRSIEPMAEPIWQDALSRNLLGVKLDDVLDALAAALTAVQEHSALGDLQTLPLDAEHDAFGLPMEMLYRPLRGRENSLSSQIQLAGL
ncbi:MAG: DUF429 domain-containing protein [Chloroflexi bacterium]|nr:DUF429 domain-containing protein [Chloroflexota bacterium]